MPFSLMCSSCDNGSDVLSQEQAEAEGSIELELDDDGLSWSWRRDLSRLPSTMGPS